MNYLPKTSTKRFIKIGEASNKLGVSIDTLRRWEKAGKIETVKTPGGTRLYSTSSLKNVITSSKEITRTESSVVSRQSSDTSAPLSTVEDLLNIKNLDEKTTPTDLKLPEYFDGRKVEPETMVVFAESELLPSSPSVIPSSPRHPELVSGSRSRNEFGMTRGFGITTRSVAIFSGALATLLITSIILAKVSNFNQLSVFSHQSSDSNKQRLTMNDERYTVNSSVLAATSTSHYLVINTDLAIEGDLAVSKTINGLTITPNTDGFSIAGGNASRKVTVVGGDVTLDQDVSTNGSPSFQVLTLPATENQISMGGAGTISWTPTGTQVITLPDATGAVLLDKATQTITNKTISGSSNTVTNLPNSALTNHLVTVTAGTNLSGGGDIEFGGSGTLALKPDITLTSIIASGNIKGGTMTSTGLLTSGSVATPLINITQGSAPAPTTDNLYNILGQLFWNGVDLSSGGALPVGSNGQTMYHNGTNWTATSNLINNGTNVGITGGLSIGSYSSTAPPPNGLIASGNVGIGTSSPQGALQVLNGALFVSPNGNIGIGTTSPAAKFHNAGSTLFTTSSITDLGSGGNIGTAAGTVDTYTSFNLAQSTASQTVTLPTPTNTTAGRLVYLANTGSTPFTFYGSTVKVGDTTAAMWNGSQWDLAGGGGLSQGTVNNSTLRWNASSTQWVENTNFIASTTNVGIGTTDPNAPLQVVGNINATSFNNLTITANGTNTLNIAASKTLTVSDSTTLATNAITFGGGEVLTLTAANALTLTTTGTTNSTFPVGTDTLAGLGTSQTFAGSNTFSSQLISSVTTGTAPFSIASTTLNTNLNADLLDGQHGSYYFPTGSVSGATNQVAYFNGTNTLAGSNNFFFNGTNVGIGTTGPVSQLHLFQSSSGASITETKGLVIESGTHEYINMITAANKDSAVLFGGGTQGEASIGWSDGTRGNVFQITIPGSSVGSFNLQDSGSNSRIYVKNNGNVGIGTTSPTSKLQVIGDIAGTTFNGNTITSGTGILTLGASKTLTVNDSTTLGTNAITFAGGEVLTLTASNALTLTTTGTTNSTLPVGTDTLAGLGTTQNFTGLNYFSSNVGIGTTSPSATLDLVGTLQYTDGNQASNKVLVSDANGNASWTDISSGGSGSFSPWTLIGSNLYPNSTATNVAIGSTNAGSNKLDVTGSMNLSAGSLYKINNSQIVLNNLANVVTTASANGDVLQFNGAEWVNNQLVLPTAAGPATTFYLEDIDSDIPPLPATPYEVLDTIPGTTAEVLEPAVVNTGGSAQLQIDAYSTAIGGLGVTSIDAGIWEFDTYASVSQLVGASEMLIDVYSRTAGGTETLLFSTTTGTLDTTGVRLYSPSSVQPAFVINATDRLIIKYTASTAAAVDTTVTLYHGGTEHYSHLHTPLTAKHNNLAGLQGGTTNEFYHLTSAEYTGSGTGVFARVDSPVFTTPTLGAASATSLALSGGTLTSTGALTITPQAGNNLNIALSTTGDFVVNSNQLYVDTSTGNVGIGTTSPSAFMLQVAGSVGPQTNDLYDLGSDANRWANIYLGPETLHIGTSTSDEGYLSYTTSSNVLNLQSTGNLALQPTGGYVGIGTTAPSYPLHVNATTGTAAGYFSNSDGVARESAALYAVNTALPNDSSSIGISSSGLTHGILSSVGWSGATAHTFGGNFVNSSTSSEVNLKQYGIQVSTSGVWDGAGSSSYGGWFSNYSESSVASLKKYGLYIASSGVWDGAGAINYGLYVATPTGGTTNVAAYFGGNVGIGTTGPSGKLTIDTQSTVVNSVETAGALVLRSTNAQAADLGPQMRFSGQTGDAVTPFAYATIAGRKENGTASNFAGYLQFSTTKSTSEIAEAMRITSAGNVGIGTTAPGAYKLNVSGNTLLSDTYTDTINSINAGDPLEVNYRSTSPTKICATTSCATVSAWFGTDGNVGIGTTAPAQKLDVSGSIGLTGSVIAGDKGRFGGTGYNGLYIETNYTWNADASIWHNAHSTSDNGAGTITYAWNASHASFGSRGINFSYGNNNSTGITFYADAAASTANSTFTPTQRMIITNQGSVGIGIANPQQQVASGTVLHLSGGENGSEPALVLGNVSNQTAGNRGRIDFSGTANNGNPKVPASILGKIISSGTNTVVGALAVEVLNGAGPGGTEMARFDSTGVGIGTTSPAYKLDVNGTGRFSDAVRFDSAAPLVFMAGSNTGTYTQTVLYANQNNTSGSNVNGIMIERGRLTDASNGEVRYFTIGARGGQVQWKVDGTGNVVQSGSLTQNGSPDIAENINIQDVSIEGSDIVVSSTSDSDNSNIYNRAIASKSTIAYDKRIIGVISSDPGIVLNSKKMDTDKTSADNERVLTLAGRVPVKVSTENGNIETGDYLTSSSTPGVAMKATKPGQVVGKALENYPSTESANGEVQFGKILVFVNVSYADPNNQLADLTTAVFGTTVGANPTTSLYQTIQEQQVEINNLIASQASSSGVLAGLKVDSDGVLQTSAIKTDKLLISDPGYIAITESNGSLVYDPAVSLQSSVVRPLDVLATLKTIDSKLAELSGTVAGVSVQISSQSAQISSLQAQVASLSAQLTNSHPELVSGSTPSGQILNQVQNDNGVVADSSSSANSEQPTANSLNLTPPSILLATTSAQLVDLTVTSEATFSGKLTAYSATIQDTFKSLGDSFLGNTTVAGNFSVDGTLSVTGNSINSLGGCSSPQGSNNNGGSYSSSECNESRSTLGILYIQNNPLAQSLDILNGAFTFNKDGTLTIAGTVVASQFAVKKDTTAGIGTIPANQTDIIIENTYVDESSVILVTPHSPLSQTIGVADRVKGGFLVQLAHTETQDIKFDYIIIGVRQ